MAKAPITQTKIIGLAGNDEPTNVLGDPKDAQQIAKATLDVIRCFVEAIIREDIEAAYGLCANELRCWMSVQRFVTELDKANAEYNGKPLEFEMTQINWLYADAASRNLGSSDHRWPKDTPKPNKRAEAYGWLTDMKAADGNEFGRYISFWVTEEAEGYRIAKFQNFSM